MPQSRATEQPDRRTGLYRVFISVILMLTILAACGSLVAVEDVQCYRDGQLVYQDSRTVLWDRMSFSDMRRLGTQEGATLVVLHRSDTYGLHGTTMTITG
jgi:hypothetical protein